MESVVRTLYSYRRIIACLQAWKFISIRFSYVRNATTMQSVLCVSGEDQGALRVLWVAARPPATRIDEKWTMLLVNGCSSCFLAFPR